ncbi:MAG: thioredoxin domain-containing protein [Rhodospirillales bacterium]|nr:thioredoxin domain-containing protein [Rhodospirillales bacterium]MCB9997199.1 thioredoxin domain-containing protein [Rhodospirillales bacterium]
MIRDKKKLLLIGLYGLVILLASYAGYRAYAVQSMTQAMYVAEFGQFDGPEDADKVIVEFLDYRCSYCRIIYPVVQELLERNPDVKVVYRHYPVFLRPSIIEAEVALAAGMQGKFRDAHDDLMQREEPITDREIDDLARNLGLDIEKFRTDMKGPEIGYLLLQTIDAVEMLGIGSTPSFMIGDRIFTLEDGMPDVEAFEKILAEEYGS